MTTGDFNADGKTDLAVGETIVSSSASPLIFSTTVPSLPKTFLMPMLQITGEASSEFGKSMTAGDFNADGKTDLAVGTNAYSSNAGRGYIFYNDGSIPTTAATADIIITGDASSRFGSSMTAGDFNADGRVDLAVGAYAYSSNAGQVYIYETRENYAWQLQPQKTIRANPISGQEMKITGEAGSYFGNSMTVGDFNADGKTDLAVGAYAASSYAGRAYIFYNDGSIPRHAPIGADVITGEASSRFGFSITAGDFNADGKTDLTVGAVVASSAGRAYVFYNGSIVTENATGADVIITGEASSRFGTSMTSGDFNADGKADLAVGAYGYSSYTGRAYVFYNGAIITKNASSADAIITGSSYFGYSMTNGDFNADGKTDLAVGAVDTTGHAYIFYNGSITTEDATGADIIITGEAASNSFSYSMTAGDFNADGKTDLAVGANGYSSRTGRAYIFYNGAITTENASGADFIITGEATASEFGVSMTSGDFNADGRIDLAVGAYSYYNASSGRAHIFYNDGSMPSTAATADVIVTRNQMEVTLVFQ